jgi:hypothetical protein
MRNFANPFCDARFTRFRSCQHLKKSRVGPNMAWTVHCAHCLGTLLNVTIAGVERALVLAPTLDSLPVGVITHAGFAVSGVGFILGVDP